LGKPRWRDTRLLIGVLLVGVSVVVGARVFAAADATRSWVVARVDLPAGHVVTAEDLATADADLASRTSSLYYPAERLDDLVGGTLARPVSSGELVSGPDFAGTGVAPTRLVPLIVQGGRMPALSPGDHVAVYVFQRDASVPAPGTNDTRQPASAAPPVAGAGAEVLVLHDVEVVASTPLSSGSVSLTLRVPVDDAIRAVAASQSERVDVVRLERDGGGEVGPAGPTEAPGYGQ
jgi:hypothetical protein